MTGADPSRSGGTPAGRGLRRDHFSPLAVNGWGDGYNSYAHSMAWFNGMLYVGVARGNLYLIRRYKKTPHWPFYPVRCPDDPYTLDLRARIWRWDPASSEWDNVHTSAMFRAKDGSDVPCEIGYRGMAVFQGPSDSAPALYVASFSPRLGPGPMVYRSEDGTLFEPVSEPGFGYEELTALRSLVPFKGRLFALPVGSVQNRPNVSVVPVVFESRDPARGDWRPASEPGFGNPANVCVFELAEFNGHLYAGTGNVVTGFELWKTDGAGDPPYTWTRVVHLGGYRGNLNEGVVSLCVFKDALYVGTAIQDGGYDRTNNIGPAAGEVLRVYADDSWDLVAGTPRLTPQGVKMPTSGLWPGFNNFFNGYIWRMCVHDGWLYVGTWDWSTFLQYIDITQWPETLREVAEQLGIEETIRDEGGCDLVRTRDGVSWYRVTRNGFDNIYNCGVRTMVSTPYGLAVGTVNPFGPEVAVKRDGRWDYEPNPRGGLEVWLGRDGGRAASDDDDHDDLLVPFGAAASNEKTAKRGRQKTPEIAAESFELSREQLQELGRRINVDSVRPDYMALTYKVHHLSVDGEEHLPRDRPVLIACNHIGSAVFAFTSIMAEDALLYSHVLKRLLGRPARILADLGFYDTKLAARMCRELNERMGCVPITIGNGVRLLEMGETVLIYPEGRFSSPDYVVRPLFWGFVKIAWMAGVPIVPSVMIGPHESRQRVEIERKALYLNAWTPLPVDYKYILLPEIDPRDHVSRLDDREALREFCELVRERMQAALDEEKRNRPLIAQIRALQDRYGGSSGSERSGA